MLHILLVPFLDHVFVYRSYRLWMATGNNKDAAMIREKFKLQAERENYIARIQSIAVYAESLTHDTLHQFKVWYANINHLIGKFNDLQFKIVDFNSRIVS